MLAENRFRLLHAAVVAALLASASPAAMAAVTATAPVPGHVANWVARASKVGTAPDSQSVTIAVFMALKNQAALKKLADEVATPGSEHYGQYLSVKAFRNRFAPDAADVAAVQALLGKAGMSSITVGPGGAYVSAQATVRQLRKTFAVSQDLYEYKGKTMRANREEPTLPAALAGKIVYVEGLDDTTFLKQPFHRSVMMGAMAAPAAVASDDVTAPPVAASLPSPYCDTYFGDLKATLSTTPAPYAATEPWLICGYTPQQIQAAYGLNKVRYNGAGVRVGILDAYASPTLQADENRYAANHHLPKLTRRNFQEIIPEGIYNVPAAQVTNAYGWWGEESLDVAAVHGAAPGATIIYIGSTDNGTSLDIALQNAIYNHTADILTNSYGYNGEAVSQAQVTADDQAFMAGVAQGITVLFSSGDNGDLSQSNGVATGAWEATSSYVTGVGGTSLALTDARGAKSEYGWGTYRGFLAGATVNSGTSITTSGLVMATNFGLTYDDFAFYAGSGGGISLIEPQPSYQASVVPASLATTLNSASGSTIPVSAHRVSPDVAMLADPYTGYLYPETFTTSPTAYANNGCTPKNATTEYCETPIGGTSLASPLFAGMVAVMDQARLAKGDALVGFANPLFYSYASGPSLTSAGLNQILPPASPVSVLRGYVNNPSEVRVVTINSAPEVLQLTPFALEVCAATICEGLNDVFNYTTPGYNDVTGLGVPYAPYLIKE